MLDPVQVGLLLSVALLVLVKFLTNASVSTTKGPGESWSTLLRVAFLNHKPEKGTSMHSEFVLFGRNFFVVFFLLKLADWIQGPYFYAAYAQKFKGNEYGADLVGQLFLCGFVSSMVIGTYVGGKMDSFGRKKGVVLLCVLNCVSALTLHMQSFWVLAVGRVLGGVATSLLFSVPEAWMVTEFNTHNWSGDKLNSLFGWMFFGDGLVAIFAGFSASAVADRGGPEAVFDVSALVLVISLVAVVLLWNENKGSTNVGAGGKKSVQAAAGGSGFSDGLAAIFSSSSMVSLGAAQSFFEGAMYSFVLLWVPVFQSHCTTAAEGPLGVGFVDSWWGQICAAPPFGQIFAMFMVWCMIGSSLFSMMMTKGMAIQTFMPLMLFTAFVSIGAAAALGFSGSAVTPPVRLSLLLLCFCVFEGCVGLYFPCIGTLRSELIPDAVRSTVINYFRIPLNLIVILLFSNLSKVGNSGGMVVACALLFVSMCSVQFGIGKKEKKK
jgi:MFS family permease